MCGGFPGASDGKESACNIGDPSSIPGSGRSSGVGNSNPLQYSCLENAMDRGASGLSSIGCLAKKILQKVYSIKSIFLAFKKYSNLSKIVLVHCLFCVSVKLSFSNFNFVLVYSQLTMW